jgi:hypothetical protein
MRKLHDAVMPADLNADAARAGLRGGVDLPQRQAGRREDDRAVFDGVLVEQDASLGIAQQPCQRGLAVEEWEIALYPCRHAR